MMHMTAYGMAVYVVGDDIRLFSEKERVRRSGDGRSAHKTGYAP